MQIKMPLLHFCLPRKADVVFERVSRWYVARLPSSLEKVKRHLRALATETTSQLDVLRLDGDTLGVDGAEVRIFKEGDEVGLNGFLEGTDSG